MDSSPTSDDQLEAERFTRKLALSHYENFIVGGILTPKHLRQHFYNVYAYCRMADDLADELATPQESLEKLAQWEDWLRDCYAQRPVEHPVFRALGSTIRKFEIPIDPFLQLLSAFRQDQQGIDYLHHGQLVDYCQRSANPVGHLVLYLGESFNPQRAALADFICTGLQLANFWQDIGRDARRGRYYVPQNIRYFYQIDREALALPFPPPQGQEMVAALVRRAEEYFYRGLPLVHDVPKWLARNVYLFASGGLAILREIRRARFDVWTQRPVVSRWRQSRLIWRALRGRWPEVPPLPPNNV